MVNATSPVVAQERNFRTGPDSLILGPGGNKVNAVQSTATYNSIASVRWATSRTGSTAVASGENPDATMNHPTAPCSPPNTKNPTKLGNRRRSSRPVTANQ